MNVQVNGQTIEVDDTWTVADAVRSLGISDFRGIAVAVDREVIPADCWEAVILSEGRQVEILRAVQGGAG